MFGVSTLGWSEVAKAVITRFIYLLAKFHIKMRGRRKAKHGRDGLDITLKFNTRSNLQRFYMVSMAYLPARHLDKLLCLP